jgi:D-aminoacyl-tRNA deacylase
MRLIIQRVCSASVTTAGTVAGSIGVGMCIFLGVKKGDDKENVERLTEKVTNLRIFEDEQGKMNRSVLEIGGEVLVVSEFTLYGNCSKGHRPSFSDAAPAAEAEKLYGYFVECLRQAGLKVATGVFQAKMDVTMINDGPVTFILEG